MAEPTPQPAAAPARETFSAEELKKRNEWFTLTPDPWAEIALLDYAGDRTYASTVSDMVAKAEFAQHPVLEAKLIKALATPGITDAGRLFICRMLGLIGSTRCIAAVLPLLNDVKSADVARIALDGIDDPAVTEGYRAALPKLTGAPKAGLIGSMAMRGDTQSVDAFVAIALDTAESIDVRNAAERAAEKLSVQA